MGPHSIQQDKTTSDAKRTRNPTGINDGGKQTVIDMQAWADYYSNEQNLEKISYQMRWREVVVIQHLADRNVAIRPFKCFSLEHIKFIIERLNIKTVLSDLYISNASVRLPKLPSDMHKMKETREYLNTNWNRLVVAYDIFVDIDAGSEDDEPLCIAWARKIRNELIKKGYGKTMPIEIWKTGSGGVHVILKGKFKPEFVKDLIADVCLELDIPMNHPVKTIDGERYLAKNRGWVKMKPKEEVPEIERPFCDLSVYDGRRIRRCPYSLHSKSGKPMVKVL